MNSVTLIEPYPVRVWWGYAGNEFRNNPQEMKRFHKLLGSIFIPATVEMMKPLGLTAYLPAIVPHDTNPNVPDEIALVFYQSREKYLQCRETVAGRTYSLLHTSVFNFSSESTVPASHSNFPEKYHLTSPDKLPGYYFLFDKYINWQSGTTSVMVGVSKGISTSEFYIVVAEYIDILQNDPPPALDGVVFSVFGDCLVLWCHWMNGTTGTLPLLDIDDRIRIVLSADTTSINIPSDLWNRYPGIHVTEGNCFTTHFE